MKNIFDVLRQKELELQQLQRDIEALRVAARLLADDTDNGASAVRPVVASAPAPRPANAVMAKPADSGFGPPPAAIRQFP